MLNLGSITSSSSHIFRNSSNFWNHRWGTETGAFPWPSCYCFCKNDRIAISVLIILSINQLSLYHLKKFRMDNQIYISQLSTLLIFYKLLFEVKKIDVRLNQNLKLKFIFMFFNRVCPTRYSDTATKYTAFPLSYWWPYSNSLGSYFATLSYG